MPSELTEKITPLAMDLDQWRRDIKIFLETTEDSIEAIVAQLSSRCSTDFSHQNGDNPSPTGTRANPNELAIPRRNNDDGQDRLRELKAILAQRIAKQK